MGLFQEKHKHKWAYMFSNADNTIQAYHCTECLAQAYTEIDYITSKVKNPTIFETTKPLNKKKN